MDGSGCLTDWHTEVDVEFPLTFQRKHLGLENELMEILWHNGEAVLHRQTNKKSRSDSTSEFNHQADDDEDEDEDKDEDLQPVPWINSLANETFHKDLCTNLLPQIPASHQPSEKSGAGVLTPLLMPPERFGSFETGDQNRTLDDLQFAYKNREVSNGKGCFIMDPSVMMAKEIRDGSIGKVANEVNIRMDSGCHVIGSKNLPDEIKSVGMENMPFDGCRQASSQSSDNTTSKKKRRVAEEPESDATELESPPDGNNVPSKKPAPRRHRVAQVHNLSERRRRDRINEKMHALQALIPHSNKRDKASVLDEAIEYMKSLQLQLQWWMGTGMARMMHPRTQQQYMYHAGIGIRQPTFPPMQNVMRLPNQAPMGHGLVLGNRVHQNQMQNGAQPYSHPAPENDLSVQLRNGTANNLKTR